MEEITQPGWAGAAGAWPWPIARMDISAPPRRRAWPKWMLLRWESTAAFDRPVVPLVNNMRHGSSSSTGTSGNGASDPGSRSMAPSSNTPIRSRSGVATFQAFEASSIAENHEGRRQLERMRHFRPGPPAIEGDDNRAEREGRPHGDDVLGTAGRSQGDPVAPVDAIAVLELAGHAGTVGTIDA